ncbi:hypothetical protein J2744_001954 [Halorubrum trapanicum]|uniref:DUF8135 domain-containing protein n=1 Tax=Halorubrum trapanicum TaxID=29284 RepID=A0A8J7ULJ1_9EURY|nr:hypothetical protein [Halorubrum trapanicum]MBP1902270.1 hypothetical protein [Halorubrum trapanicum]
MSDGDRPDDDASDDPFGDELFGDGPSDATEEPFAEADGDDADEVDDPFAALGDGVDEGDEGATDAAAAASSHGDPEPAAPADDPFAELDADAGDASDGEDPFESMEVGDVGEEDVWAALDEESSVGADATGFDAESGSRVDPGDATGFGGPGAGAGAGGDERVVDKRSYCQQCPHFSAPPETACTHEGTDIVESVDFSRFRVRNCPMVDAEDPAFDEE